MKGSRV
jgi:hypothetical protein